jgi:hypothetical protein
MLIHHHSKNLLLIGNRYLPAYSPTVSIYLTYPKSEWFKEISFKPNAQLACQSYENQIKIIIGGIK